VINNENEKLLDNKIENDIDREKNFNSDPFYGPMYEPIDQ
jgi:hypothetical protein